jgi:hypothetical protein
MSTVVDASTKIVMINALQSTDAAQRLANVGD